MATSTTTVTDIVTKTIASVTPSSTLRATPQGGILEGGNPSKYSPTNPIILFIIQASIILIFCRILQWPLSLLRQPRVIAEVIGGILLGPSVMGHVPGFTEAIFPKDSIPNLTLVANLGLTFFLFLVGLEVDLRYFASNWKIATSVGTAGMALPFGLGWAIAYGLYHQFRDEVGVVPISFGTYGLFIAVAMSITAFPVLCRILTELKLLSTPVGVIVLSAGVSNDVVGWILLALCVALVNAGSGLTALWILLACAGYAIFLVFAVRPAFMWILRRTHSLQDGPSQSIIALTLLITLTSAFFTGVIGVHPIFGAFMAGLICPHEGGFAIKVTEKIEDLVSTLFLPLYFALSGLSTNLGLLDDGITWAYVFGVIAVAFCSKFAGGTLAAKANGLVWRESFTIGSFMSCKGLVELIVLNIGLQAKILSQRTFTIFVLMALITTFATTPLVKWLYPPWYQRQIEAWKLGAINRDNVALTTDAASDMDPTAFQKLESTKVRSLLVYLRLDNMPALLALVSLLGKKQSEMIERKHPSFTKESSGVEEDSPAVSGKTCLVEIHGVRLIELTDRGSAVMKVSEVDEYGLFDPVLNGFRVLGQLYNLAVSGEVNVVPEFSYADTLTAKAAEESSDLLLLPWSETGSMSESHTISNDSVHNKLKSNSYSAFIVKVLDQALCNTAVFVNKDFSGSLKRRPGDLQRSMSYSSVRSHHREHVQLLPSADRSHHIFMPFCGGADGRVALRLVLQLAENPEVTATILHFKTESERTANNPRGEHIVVTDKGDSMPNPETDHDDVAFFATMQRSVAAELQKRVVFGTRVAASPIQDVVAVAREELAQNPRNGGDIVVLGRNKTVDPSDLGGCLGEAADAILTAGIRASVLVVQARGSGLD